MRLINANTLEFEYFENEASRPKYATLSHRWIDKQEVTYHEFVSRSNEQKTGWDKIRFCCNEALAHELDGVWIDTCCIDKSSSAELTEAINSMFRWYGSAATCFAYLNDVSEANGTSIENSLWFTRAWALQELIAPTHLRFYDSRFRYLGTKNDLLRCLQYITRIPEEVLKNPEKMYQNSIATRMSWAATRKATRTEDIAYSLFGRFEINLPLLQSNDRSIFFWNSPGHGYRPLLAAAPIDFENTLWDHEPRRNILNRSIQEIRAYAVTNAGLQIDCKMSPCIPGVWIAWIDRCDLNTPAFFLSRKRADLDTWCRVKFRDTASWTLYGAESLSNQHDIWPLHTNVRLRGDPGHLFHSGSITFWLLFNLKCASWTNIYIDLKPGIEEFEPIRTAYGIHLELSQKYDAFALVSNYGWDPSLGFSSEWPMESPTRKKFKAPSGLFPILPFQEGLAGAIFFATPTAGLSAIILGFDRHFKPTAVVIPEESEIDIKDVFKHAYPYQSLETFQLDLRTLWPWLSDILCKAFGSSSEYEPKLRDDRIEILRSHSRGYTVGSWVLKATTIDEHSSTMHLKGYWRCRVHRKDHPMVPASLNKMSSVSRECAMSSE